VLKPFNPNGTNIYGNDGYQLLDEENDFSDLPTGVTVSQVPGNLQFPGNSGYTVIDKPGGGTMTSGVWFTNCAANTYCALATISFAVSADYMIGIYTDNTDHPDYSAADLDIVETAGGSANSGEIVNPQVTDPNPQQGYWFFVDINASAGSTFAIEGMGGNVDDIGGAITFDGYEAPPSPTTPEPGTLLLLGSGLLAVGRFTRRRIAAQTKN